MRRFILILLAFAVMAGMPSCYGMPSGPGPDPSPDPDPDPVGPSFAIEDYNQSTSGGIWRISGSLRNISSETQNVEALTFILWSGGTIVGQETIPLVISLAPAQAVRFTLSVNTHGKPFDDVECRVSTDEVKW